MIYFMEKIDPPSPIPLTDDEQLQVIAEAFASEDRWARDFIGGWRASFETSSTEAR